MNDCDRVLEQLYEYINRHDVDPETCREIRVHLEACRGCFTRFEFEVRIIQRFKDAGCCSCPESLKKKIQELVDRF